MSQSAAPKLARSSTPVPLKQETWTDERCTFAVVDSMDLKRIPFGAIHVNQDGEVLERRSGPDRVLLREDYPRPHLFSLAHWLSDPVFVDELDTAIRSNSANVHFDFTIGAYDAVRTVHVNILAFGDTTAWLFLSDRTLWPF
jgi:hypothetical protein